ncbi:MAG: LapA family protein [bacterium]|nr:MAG: LapA family protein [bacterium]
MKYVYALFIFLMALFLAAFIQQNGEDIVLKYFSWHSPPLPISLYMILALAGGYALAVVVGLSGGIRTRVRTIVAEREVKRLRAELQGLREREKELSSESLEGAPTAAREAPGAGEDIPETPGAGTQGPGYRPGGPGGEEETKEY